MNEAIYGSEADAERILACKVAPPPEFQPVYDLLNEYVREVRAAHPRVTSAHDRSVAASLNALNLSRHSSLQSQLSPPKNVRSGDESGLSSGEEAQLAQQAQQADGVTEGTEAAAAQRVQQSMQERQQAQQAQQAQQVRQAQQQQQQQAADGDTNGADQAGPAAAAEGQPPVRHVAWANGGSNSGKLLPPIAPRLGRGSAGSASDGSPPRQLRRSGS
jgi:hypothetical protein